MDAIVDDRVAATLSGEQRSAHDVLGHYGYYVNSDAKQRMELREAAMLEIGAVEVRRGRVVQLDRLALRRFFA